MTASGMERVSRFNVSHWGREGGFAGVKVRLNQAEA